MRVVTWLRVRLTLTIANGKMQFPVRRVERPGVKTIGGLAWQVPRTLYMRAPVRIRYAGTLLRHFSLVYTPREMRTRNIEAIICPGRKWGAHDNCTTWLGRSRLGQFDNHRLTGDAVHVG